MEKVDYFTTAKPDVMSKNPAIQLLGEAIRLRSFREPIKDFDDGFAVQISGNSSGGNKDIYTTIDGNINVADSIAAIRSRRIDEEKLHGAHPDFRPLPQLANHWTVAAGDWKPSLSPGTLAQTPGTPAAGWWHRLYSQLWDFWRSAGESTELRPWPMCRRAPPYWWSAKELLFAAL